MKKERQKTSPKERLARMLKQSSSIPELKEFREQCRDVYRIGGIFGLEEWIDARREYGLLDNRYISKAADDLLGVIGSAIDAATVKPEAPQGLTWEEKEKLIIKREEEARNNVRFVGTKITPSMQSRMAKGFDQMLDREIASVRRGAP